MTLPPPTSTPPSTCPSAKSRVAQPHGELPREALDAARGHAAWLAEYGPTSWDQYDFWATAAGRRAKRAYYGDPRRGALLVAPFVLLDWLLPQSRRLVRPRSRFPIADAHYAMGFCFLVPLLGRGCLEQAVSHLEALIEQRCPSEHDYCWGYPFHWETCFGTWRSGTPLITSTPYGYEAFEAAYELTGAEVALQIMRSIGSFAYARIPSCQVGSGGRASAYSPFDRRRVVNASAYRGFLLSHSGLRFGCPEWVEEARQTLAFVLSCQRADGSWLYAMDGRDAFVDNFHTCFVIKNLYKAWLVLRDDGLLRAVLSGYSFYKTSLLDDHGLPRPFAETQRLNLTRRELYDYAEGINLAALLIDIDPDAEQILHTLCRDLLDNWVLPDGRFLTRRMIARRNTVPYHRWAQAQTFRALAYVASLAKD